MCSRGQYIYETQESTILLFSLLETIRDFGNVALYKINVPVSTAFLYIKSSFFRKYKEKYKKQKDKIPTYVNGEALLRDILKRLTGNTVLLGELNIVNLLVFPKLFYVLNAI